MMKRKYFFDTLRVRMYCIICICMNFICFHYITERKLANEIDRSVEFNSAYNAFLLPNKMINEALLIA